MRVARQLPLGILGHLLITVTAPDWPCPVGSMSCYSTHWGDFLGEDSELPTDVIFEIHQEQELWQEQEQEQDEVKEIGEVRAHKFVLSAVSPVFRRQFYGAFSRSRKPEAGTGVKTGEGAGAEEGEGEGAGEIWSEREERVVIKGTTIEAFKSLVQFVYYRQQAVLAEVQFIVKADF